METIAGKYTTPRECKGMLYPFLLGNLSLAFLVFFTEALPPPNQNFKTYHFVYTSADVSLQAPHAFLISFRGD